MSGEKRALQLSIQLSCERYFIVYMSRFWEAELHLPQKRVLLE